ncbi:MAG: DUF4440 domain-containing protein [Gammaproteobacteria bacterium]|nr:DUF4440 domain-containing protein [Gammaproteobacteria bacterium]MDH3410441.1 DUF4440 domain-containing protein [Gammaproteobacteria bacterium]
MKLLAVIFSSLLCASPAVADLTDDVRCREIAFSQSVETKNPDQFRSFIDDDARFVSDIVRRGPDAITEAWAPFLSETGPRIQWRPQFVEVLADGKLALTRGPYRLVATDPDGNEIEHWGTFNSVWRLHDTGEWKVVLDAGSPAADAPPEAVQALLDQEDNCDD